MRKRKKNTNEVCEGNIKPIFDTKQKKKEKEKEKRDPRHYRNKIKDEGHDEKNEK